MSFSNQQRKCREWSVFGVRVEREESLFSLCCCFRFSLSFPHLHHQNNGVESYHGQDGVLKRGRHHKMPQSVLECVSVLGHVTSQRLGADGEVYACPLKYKKQEQEREKERKTRETQRWRRRWWIQRIKIWCSQLVYEKNKTQLFFKFRKY